MTSTTRTYLKIVYVAAMLVLPEIVTRLYFAGLVGPRVLWYGTSHFRRNRVDGMDADEDLRNHRSGREIFLRLQSALDARTVESHSRGREGFDTFQPHETRYHWDIDTHQTFKV